MSENDRKSGKKLKKREKCEIFAVRDFRIFRAFFFQKREKREKCEIFLVRLHSGSLHRQPDLKTEVEFNDHPLIFE